MWITICIVSERDSAEEYNVATDYSCFLFFVYLESLYLNCIIRNREINDKKVSFYYRYSKILLFKLLCNSVNCFRHYFFCVCDTSEPCCLVLWIWKLKKKLLKFLQGRPQKLRVHQNTVQLSYTEIRQIFITTPEIQWRKHTGITLKYALSDHFLTK